METLSEADLFHLADLGCAAVCCAANDTTRRAPSTLNSTSSGSSTITTEAYHSTLHPDRRGSRPQLPPQRHTTT
eukprot:2550603-Pleurochrysis_carterae.AAC.4